MQFSLHSLPINKSDTVFENFVPTPNKKVIVEGVLQQFWRCRNGGGDGIVPPWRVQAAEINSHR
eukprot:12931313-Prorocentrum_lima.AAC.1